MHRPFAVAVALALAVLIAAAALDDRERAFTTGLPANDLAASLRPGEQDCADGIDAPVRFQRVRLVVGTYGRPGPALRVALTEAGGGRRLGGAAVPGGYPDNGSVEMTVGDVPGGIRLRVCVRNTGSSVLALFGNKPDRDPERSTVPAVVFIREPPTTMLSLVPEAVHRSALFKPGWYGPWTTWLLLAVAALAVPAALGRALAAAYASERSSSASAGTATERSS
jgi:hypothetical protein